MSEQKVAVPLGELYLVCADQFGQPWLRCFLGECRHNEYDLPRAVTSAAEARSAAIAHLATEHGITPLVEAKASVGCIDPSGPCGNCDACFTEMALRSADSGRGGHWPTVAGYLAAAVRDLRAEVARLRSAGEEAADDIGWVSRGQIADAAREVARFHGWSPQAVWELAEEYEAEVRVIVEALGFEIDDRPGTARLRSAGDGAADGELA